MNLPTYNRGDVILVNYGTYAAPKHRPMVVISGSTFHNSRPYDVLAALVTAQTAKYQGPTDYLIQDLSPTGLNRPSVVRCTLVTVDTQDILSRIGSLSPRDLAGIEACLRRAMEL